MKYQELKYRSTVTKEDLEYFIEHGINDTSHYVEGEDLSVTAVFEMDGRRLAMGGIVRLTKTTAMGWVELVPDAGSHIIKVYRTIKAWRDKTCREQGIIRFEAWIDVDNDVAIRFNEHLGLRKESVMKNFMGIGKDAFMYAKFYEGK